MGFVELLKKRAKESVKTIVLPETEDMRTLEATDKILKEGVAKIILIGNEEEINKKAAEGGFDISGATIVDPETSDRTQAYIDKFVELRAKKGMTPEKAKEILHTQYPYYGVMMVKMGDAQNNLDFSKRVGEDASIIIPAGKWHNLINIGNEPIKLFSIYAPPQHPKGTVHLTKADAEH